MRMSDYLQEQSVAFETLLHPPAFTAQRRAKHLRLPGKQVVKCVLLAGANEFVVAVMPATHWVDLALTGAQLTGPVRLATREEIADVFRDCEWGVLSPFGSLYGLSTLVDTSVDPDAWIVFEAHLHGLAIRMRCRDFEKLEHPRRLTFARTWASRTPDRRAL
jgi:Ala-tRNA(Pro) deacylase